jgi:tetratricopeptide (TPR) repeat protein
MKKLILITLTCVFIQNTYYAQQVISAYDEGLLKVDSAKYEQAIALFDTYIATHKKNHLAWYNRGVAKLKLKQYEAALLDFDRVVQLKRAYKEGYLSRGTVKEKLTDYEGALADFSKAIALDSNYAEAYFNRGHIYGLLSQKENACADYTIAHKKGMDAAREIVRRCNNVPFSRIPKHAILRLTSVSDDETYGVLVENPIQVGMNIEGEHGNEIAYLELLRDVNGKPVKYEYLGSCCQYPSPYGGFGVGSLEKYGLTYVNEQGVKEELYIFLTIYDYNEPKIIKGFKTLGIK